MQKIRYTAFIDILGFSNYIKTKITNEEEGDLFYNSINKDLIECLEHLKKDNYNEQFSKITHLRDIKLDYLWISDTFVLSIENKNNTTSIEEENQLKAMMIFILSLSVSYINFYFIKEYNLCIRGGITSKFTYLKDRLLLGEGISESHNLEANIAVNPRVIFARDIINKEIKDILTLNKSPLISKDCDGYYFINYMNVLEHTPPMCGKPISQFKINREGKESIQKKLIESTLNNHRNLIIEGLNIGDEKVSAKFFWLKEYHNKYISESSHSDDLIIL